MNQPHGLLRKRLQERDPVLFQCLEKSWEIAHQQWLSTVKIKSGSFNSYPHLRNVENYIDEIIRACERLTTSRGDVGLTPAEIYLLLSAVLFHDIGRILPDPEEIGHGELARQFIKSSSAHLGIPSIEFARSLGNIIVYHKPPKGRSRAQIRRKLATTVIDPFGVIRERFLAALLTLADSMDTAYTRAIPSYLSKEIGRGIVGQFRRSIRGVYADPFTRMVRTVLPIEEYTEEDNGTKYSLVLNPDFKENDKLQKRLKQLSGVKNIKKLQKMFSDIFNKTGAPSKGPRNNLLDVERKLRKILSNNFAAIKASIKNKDTNYICENDLDHLYEILSRRRKNKRKKSRSPLYDELLATTPIVHWFLVCGFLQVTTKETDKTSSKHPDESISIQLPKKTLLAAALGDLRNSTIILNEIQEPLAEAGIFLNAWLIERDEHLYNKDTYETYESFFSVEYLTYVANGMWNLSTRVFGSSQFSYEDLASYVGEPEVGKVAKAVRRIAVVTKDIPSQDRLGPIYAGSSYWYWRVSQKDNRCDYSHVDAIRDKIEELVPPNE